MSRRNFKVVSHILLGDREGAVGPVSRGIRELGLEGVPVVLEQKTSIRCKYLCSRDIHAVCMALYAQT